MCGIFFSYSDKLETIAKIQNDNKRILSTLSSRGPDFLGTVSEKNFFAAHTLLSITGYREQPVRTKDYFLLFNGEIFDDYANYDEKYGDTEYLENFITREGIDAIPDLEGEYAIVTYNHKHNMVSLFTDPFRTKPLYYLLTKDTFIVSTFDDVIKNCEVPGNIRPVPANVRIDIDLKKFQVVGYKTLTEFDFCKADKTTFNDWTEAYRQSLIRRASNTKHPLFVSLSSGHDSGIIAAELADLGIPFQIYSVKVGENIQVLDERLDILAGKHGVDCQVLEMKKEEAEEMRGYLLNSMQIYHYQSVYRSKNEKSLYESDARVNGGYIASAVIAQTARKKGQFIGLYGNGGDEIYTDFYYGPKSNAGWSTVMGDWRSIAGPWPNFFGGWSTVFLGATDLLASHFSIEGRFPLLDKRTVQEFLNLSPDLKSRYYKAPMTNRMNELGFPQHDRKYGFSGADYVLYGRNG